MTGSAEQGQRTEGDTNIDRFSSANNRISLSHLRDSSQLAEKNAKEMNRDGKLGHQDVEDQKMNNNYETSSVRVPHQNGGRPSLVRHNSLSTTLSNYQPSTSTPQPTWKESLTTNELEEIKRYERSKCHQRLLYFQAGFILPLLIIYFLALAGLNTIVGNLTWKEYIDDAASEYIPAQDVFLYLALGINAYSVFYLHGLSISKFSRTRNAESSVQPNTNLEAGTVVNATNAQVDEEMKEDTNKHYELKILQSKGHSQTVLSTSATEKKGVARPSKKTIGR